MSGIEVEDIPQQVTLSYRPVRICEEVPILVDMLPKYQTSGAIGWATALAALGLVVISAAGAIVYQMLMDLLPLIILIFAELIGLCMGLKWIMARGVRWGKCRNLCVGVLIGLASGVAAAGASHYVHFDEMQTQALRSGMTFGVSDYITECMDTGWVIGKSSTGMPVQGVFVLLVWIGEALGLITCCVIGGIEGARTPFCESCSMYATKVESAFKVEAVSPELFERVKRASNVNDLVQVEGGGGPIGNSLLYTVSGCPTCDGMSTVTVKSEKVFVNNGKEGTQRVSIHEGVLLTQNEWEMLVELGDDPSMEVKL